MNAFGRSLALRKMVALRILSQFSRRALSFADARQRVPTKFAGWQRHRIFDVCGRFLSLDFNSGWYLSKIVLSKVSFPELVCWRKRISSQTCKLTDVCAALRQSLPAKVRA